MSKGYLHAGSVFRQSVVLLGLMAVVVAAGEPNKLSLRSDYTAASLGGVMLTAQEGSSHGSGEGWTLDGPYFLRSADPLEVGEIELKFLYAFEKEDDGEKHEIEFVLEWGIMDDIEFILEIPAVIGDGRVDGNGDITELGFHVRHWDEDGWMPAFATRHLVRLPTGYHSDGVDYLGRGLATWSLIPGTMRLHFNPWLKSVNGNRERDTRWFRWGAAIGFDYRIDDDLMFIADYHHRNSAEFGDDAKKSIELGMDWEFAEGETLAFSGDFDIDSVDEDYRLAVSYIIELQAH